VKAIYTYDVANLNLNHTEEQGSSRGNFGKVWFNFNAFDEKRRQGEEGYYRMPFSNQSDYFTT
jgi:hypothetical protein